CRLLIERSRKKDQVVPLRFLGKNRNPFVRHLHRLDDVVDGLIELQVIALSGRLRIELRGPESLKLDGVGTRTCCDRDQAFRLFEVAVVIASCFSNDEARMIWPYASVIDQEVFHFPSCMTRAMADAARSAPRPSTTSRPRALIVARTSRGSRLRIAAARSRSSFSLPRRVPAFM